jgi:hypothetical protein
MAQEGMILVSKLQTTRALARLTHDDLTAYVGRKLAHKTYIEQGDEARIGVRFHSTRILTFHPEGTFTVNTGGYRTVTTKQRLNALLPKGYRIYSERYVWMIGTPEGVFEFEDATPGRG